MKKWMLSTLAALSLCSVSHAQVALEQWTYTGVANNSLWVTALSDTGTGNSFGTATDYFIAVTGGTVLFSSTGFFPNEGFIGSVTHPSYAGSLTGPYQISYDILSSDFTNTGTGTGRFGWGLRSTASGTDDCNVIFEYNNGSFNLIVTDATGTLASYPIATGTRVENVKIRQLYDLDKKGNPGSFQVFYSIGGAVETEIYAGLLTLPSDFKVDELTCEVQATSNGYTWAPGDLTYVDNILFEEQNFDPKLTFLGEQVSFLSDNGLLSNSPDITYEPGDVLQIITSNINESIISVSDVSNSLQANSSAFSITPASVSFLSLAPGETYTATYEVEVLNSAVNGSNTFTVVNQIGTGADALAFPASF
jgi:hypothetical protein